MATLPVQLFFRNNRTYRVGSIKFDLLLGEDHNFSNNVTSHSVEDGSVIMDHIRNNMENGSLAGLISNFTISTNGIFSNRAQDAFDELQRLWKDRVLVTVVTVMKVYEEVAITNVDIARSDTTGEAIILNITFMKVKVVKLKAVEVDLAVTVNDMKTDGNRQAAPSAQLGRTVGVTP